MAYRNKGESSCSGVAFIRDELTRVPESSTYRRLPTAMMRSQASQPLDVSELRDWMTAHADQLTEILPELEGHYEDKQDT